MAKSPLGRCWLSRPTNSTDQRTSSISPPGSTGAPSQLSYIDAGLVDLVVPMCCIALIMVAARRIRIFLHSSSCPVSWRRPAPLRSCSAPVHGMRRMP